MYIIYFLIYLLISCLCLRSIVPCLYPAQNDALLLAHVRITRRMCVRTDGRRRRRQRPNVLKFSVSSLTWDNPCSFAPVAVRARNVYYRRRRRLRSNSQQMPLKTAQPLTSARRSHRLESNRNGMSPQIVSQRPLARRGERYEGEEHHQPLYPTTNAKSVIDLSFAVPFLDSSRHRVNTTIYMYKNVLVFPGFIVVSVYIGYIFSSMYDILIKYNKIIYNHTNTSVDRSELH